MKSMLRVVLSRNVSFSRINIIRFASNDAKKKEQEPQKVEEIVKNITIEKYGGITTLNIDRQKSRNSLDEATLHEMTAAINAFDKDPESKVLVFNGEGGTFSSGFDLDEMGTKGYNILRDAASRLLRRPLCDKPTIAAVTGYGVAEGFELALACDLRIIEDTAVVGCLGRRFGVPQSLYGARRLTSLIGLSRALDLLMTGRLITGTEAHTMGLACKLTSTGTGIGKHGKFYKLTEVPLKDWELEETYEEVTVQTDKGEKKP
ncbi:3-hydroxypropionyl-coenzyme A dehydratase [Papilio machaon]|uniref:3-hydroxypropionyl-coenzyme A dehydratase n=1 Tax=Papilio machaon TaxID=76193 RepID=A0A194QVX5_PAPMA|nr:3-hydroxypropionyl-coenzyme A dehydratase [Papilio machaon]